MNKEKKCKDFEQDEWGYCRNKRNWEIKGCKNNCAKQIYKRNSGGLNVKKLIFVIVSVVLIMLSFIFGVYLTTDSINNRSPINQNINDNGSIINNLQNQLNQYKQKENEEKIRQLELQKLQNPKVILGELTKVGKLLVYKGQISYKDKIKQSNWYSSKELLLDLSYNFGIAVDLNSIIINRFYEKTVVIDIPSNQLKVEFLELDNTNTKVVSNMSLLSKQFKPEEMNVFLGNAKSITLKNIESNKQVFDKADKSLKENLKSIILKLNYKEVIFQDLK